jgi:carboxypeptidase C (cathepsin A)
MRIALAAASVLSAAFLLGVLQPALGADPPAKPDAAADKKEQIELPPLPPDASAKLSIRLGKGVLNYTATTGSLSVRDDKGKKIADVVFTAFVADGAHSADRPVTFAFNGGPGSASVYLDLGAIGPKHVPFGDQGNAPSTPAVLEDNPDTWLDFTDLVFIDPVGTGFARPLVSEEEAKKQFYTMKSDIQYLSRAVYDWLVKTGRLSSPKYIVGESYGGFRAPRIAHYLQTTQGVGVSGIVMLSPFLDGAFQIDDDTSPMGWVIRLPSMGAAKLEREGRLTPAALAQVEAYAKGEFITDYMKGPSDQAATQRLEARVAELTGIDPALAQQMAGRVDTQTLLRELYRRQGKVGSRYDIDVTAPDPFPYSYGARTGGWADPILDQIMAPATSAMVDFDTRIVGWKVDRSYEALSRDVNGKWSFENEVPDSVQDLRQAMAIDPRLKVMIAHGMTDLSTPYFASRLIIDQLPPTLDPTRVKLQLYPGGHMFYARQQSRAALHHDAASFVYGVGQ